MLLEFYHYHAQHWIHLRTTNPIESTFATVRLRQRVTKGPDSRAAGIAMTFKLIESAQARWRAMKAPHLVAARTCRRTVREGAAHRTTRRAGPESGDHPWQQTRLEPCRRTRGPLLFFPMRTCHRCNKSFSDDHAEECPFCGETV